MTNDDPDRRPLTLDYRSGGPEGPLVHQDAARRRRAIVQTCVQLASSGSMWVGLLATLRRVINEEPLAALLWFVFLLLAIATTAVTAWRWASINPPE